MNNSIYLIICDPSINSDVLRDRIKNIGPNYSFWDNHWIVKSSLSAKEIYKRISMGEFETTLMSIFEITNNYYGRMNPSIWDWLRNMDFPAKRDATKK